jgi:NADH dehydrogenase
VILIAGGTGLLGTAVVRRLTARGLAVRVLTRSPERAAHFSQDLVEVVRGDVKDPAAVQRAMAGVHTAISAIHGFAGRGADSPRSVDWQGNHTLIRAAQAAAERFLLVSVQGAAPDHPLGLFRMKYRAEQALRASALSWTIIRPTAYMETWARLVGEPLLRTGRTVIFGQGTNPINFVSVLDVAQYIELAVIDSTLGGQVIEVGGPQDLTMRQVAETFASAAAAPATVRHVPRIALRLVAALASRVNPTLARQAQAGVVMDTRDMTFDAAEAARRFPSIQLTTLAQVVQREYAPLARAGECGVAIVQRQIGM